MSAMRSVLSEDMRHNQMRTGRLAVTLVRVSQHAPRPLALVVRAFLMFVLDVDIPARTQIGPGFTLGHGGRGVVVHPDTVIGSKVWIHHRVTIAASHNGAGDAPRIGDGCIIGTGAVVVGGITLGDRCGVGPNSVVRTDVPPGVIVAGNPAVAVSQR